MKLLELSFKNICSYGNKMQVIKFTDTPQFILVQGLNGAGKSSISDALTVSIYGKSAIRKIKEIPNRLNKNAYTCVKFISSAGKYVEVSRGLEPNYSRVVIDEVEHNLPDKRRVDDFIEDELVRIPFNVFSNTISLSINDFKSFVSLSPADKRAIMDKIFGMDIVNDMSKINKADVKKLKEEISQLENTLNGNNRLLESSVNQLNNLKNEIVTSNDARIAEINTLLKNLDESRKLTHTAVSAYSPLINEISTKIRSLRDTQAKTKLNISEIQKKLDLYNQNKCPHCLSDLTDSIHGQIKEKLQQKKSEFENYLPELQTQVVEQEASLKTIEDNKDAETIKLYAVDSEVSQLKRELAVLSKPQNNNGTHHLAEVIKNIQKSIDESNATILEKRELLKVSQEMESVLSDTGMKRLLMGQIVPLLNKRIAKTAKVLEFKFAFEFDMDFNPIITHLGMPISPGSLSSGEQKKMNLIVLLGIIELIKLKHNNVNILFLDEIFSSLDVTSIYRVVDLLKAFSQKYNMTIFVISHDPLPEEFFDQKLQIENVDNFSDITFS